MPRILKYGKNPAKDRYRFTCKNCQTLFEFLCEEASTRDDRNETMFIIDCPLCGQECYIDPMSAKIPEGTPHEL